MNAVTLVANSNDVSWTYTRAVLLQEPFRVPNDAFSYHGAAFQLKAWAETNVRNLETRAGGALSLHFLDFLTKPWKACILDVARFEGSWDDPLNNIYLRTNKP